MNSVTNCCAFLAIKVWQVIFAILSKVALLNHQSRMLRAILNSLDPAKLINVTCISVHCYLVDASSTIQLVGLNNVVESLLTLGLEHNALST